MQLVARCQLPSQRMALTRRPPNRDDDPSRLSFTLSYSSSREYRSLLRKFQLYATEKEYSIDMMLTARLSPIVVDVGMHIAVASRLFE